MLFVGCSFHRLHCSTMLEVRTLTTFNVNNIDYRLLFGKLFVFSLATDRAMILSSTYSYTARLSAGIQLVRKTNFRNLFHEA